MNDSTSSYTEGINKYLALFTATLHKENGGMFINYFGDKKLCFSNIFDTTIYKQSMVIALRRSVTLNALFSMECDHRYYNHIEVS